MCVDHGGITGELPIMLTKLLCDCVRHRFSHAQMILLFIALLFFKRAPSGSAGV